MPRTLLGYVYVTGSIVEAANRVDPVSKVLRRHVADHHKLASQVDPAMNQQNIEAVKSATAMLMSWFGLIGEQATTAVNEAAGRVADAEERAKWIFRSCFAAASILLAITWWETNIRSPRA
ncbi:MAG TPA: hypothetical protein VHW24_18310 [Bryobacteraceae bacterium]|nr:hypothetical protein [Bryobacteraceae bacterium]